MNKKLLFGTVIAVIVLLLGAGGYFAVRGYINSSEVVRENDDHAERVENNDNQDSGSYENGESSEIDFKKCSADSDCFLINEGCCPCQNGGTQTAINKEYTDEWEEQLNCSDDIACAMMYNCKSDISPACIGGSCEVR